MSTYSDKLRDPRWQNKRLQILKRDKFTCRNCYSTDSELHVHHKRYEAGKSPWEYDDSILVTLCKDCHTEVEAVKSELCELLPEHTDLLKNLAIHLNQSNSKRRARLICVMQRMFWEDCFLDIAFDIYILGERVTREGFDHGVRRALEEPELLREHLKRIDADANETS